MDVEIFLPSNEHILVDYINKNSGVVVEEFGKEKEILLF